MIVSTLLETIVRDVWQTSKLSYLIDTLTKRKLVYLFDKANFL
jgi:hypothetical protein